MSLIGGKPGRGRLVARMKSAGRMDEGCKIYDSGLSPTKPSYPEISSPAYRMELGAIAKRLYLKIPIECPVVGAV